MDGCFRDDVGVQAVAEVDWVDVVAVGEVSFLSCSMVFESCNRLPATQIEAQGRKGGPVRDTYHSKSEYMIVKKTCKNRFTALMTTANR